MPIHEYECDECGVRQEELFKTASAVPGTFPCPECGTAMKKMVSAANHTFAHTPNAPVPQNTGVKAIDHSYDRVIGRDAEQKWRQIEDRNKHKESIIQDARKQGLDVKSEHLVKTREGAGDYRVIGEKERQEVNRRRKLAEAVGKAASPNAPAGE